MKWWAAWVSVAVCGIAGMGCAGGPSPLWAGPTEPSAPPARDADGLAVIAAEPPPPPVGLAATTVAATRGNDLRVFTEPGELPTLRLASGTKDKLPLEHTKVTIRLTGFVAEVEVAQTYQNPKTAPIEAVYVFPLPENSAVHDMRMVIGAREIVAQVDERKRARRTYETAKREGYTSALLEQERPNVFTQSVANIEPGKKIDVVIRYVQDLTYDAGGYELVFPMVVGPRFMPGEATDTPASGTGTHRDTRRVSDASRISPPILGKGERSGHDISIDVITDATVTGFEVPTHEVTTRRQEDGSMVLSLAKKDTLPNRDFVMRYAVAGAEPAAVLYATPKPKGEGFFSLVVQPPRLDVDALVGQRELLFVVDVSGSMHGVPLGMCRAAMRDALQRLRPVDTFNILTFAGATQAAFEAPMPANDNNVKQALAVVDGLRAGGGTQMADAVDRALRDDVAPGRHRYVFFMTDGYVGNEDEIVSRSGQFVKAIEARGQRARVFGFGVGSSVNRNLIDGLSRAGKGIAVYATNREDPARGVNRFFHYIDRVVLTDLRVDWGGLGADEVVPQPLPDLFASHPVIIHGRYTGTLPDRLTVSARAGEKEISVPVQVRAAKSEADAYDVQGALWARAKVSALEQLLWDGGHPSVQRDIIKLGIEHHLVTRFTSFVAVDRSKRVGQGNPELVVQPVEGPEDVNVEMAGGVRRSAQLALDSASLDGRLEEKESLADEPSMDFDSAPMASPAPPEPGDEGLSAMEVRGNRRGCGCRVGERSAGAGGPGAAAVLALLAVAWRRRRRVEGRGIRNPGEPV